MHPGQVWSSADFDGSRPANLDGGCGSVLAVTAQNSGADGIWETSDDILAPLNARPATVSIDASPGPNCDDRADNIRNFLGGHRGIVLFARADGSVDAIEESVDGHVLRRMSTMKD